MRRLALIACVFALVVAPGAAAAPGMAIGAAEDLGRVPAFADSKAQFELAAAAGMNAIRITALWAPGAAVDATLFQTTYQAASLSGIRLFVSAYPAVNTQVPLDSASRAAFAAWVASLAQAVPSIKDYIIGNEPNLNFFWKPQYNADGTDASPGAYVQLLAASYDALKAVDPTINVIGGSVSPAGTDKAFGKRPTHSPGRFILGMGAAYRAMGRTLPIMDSFAFHPYGARSASPPTARNPKSTRIALSDYGKLVSFLGRAFDGTPQPGSAVPIVYDEYGVQTIIPKSKLRFYTNRKTPSAVDAVTEAIQAAYYRQALSIATCQPTVQAFLFFHTVDEQDLARWQSGLFYPDLVPKTSFGPVRDAILAARAGTLTACPVAKTSK
jgi:hypothetical protein